MVICNIAYLCIRYNIFFYVYCTITTGSLYAITAITTLRIKHKEMNNSE